MHRSNTLETLVERMDAAGIASRSALAGCSQNEIADLERRYSVTLPHVYRGFLEAMGRSSGRLFRSDHWAVSYDDVLGLTDGVRRDATDAGPAARQRLDEILASGKGGGLIIAGRFFEAFLFIDCGDGDDPPVRYFRDDTWETSDAYPSTADWLMATCEACCRAIASGYFGRYPRGARP